MNVYSLTSLSGVTGATALSALQSSTSAASGRTEDRTGSARGAAAPPPPPPPSSSGGVDIESLFESLSSQEETDKTTSQSESTDALSELFADIDNDGDGGLSKDEGMSALESARASASDGAQGIQPSGPPPEASVPEAGTSDATTGSSAQTLAESLFAALTSAQQQSASTPDQARAQQFLSLLTEVA